MTTAFISLSILLVLMSFLPSMRFTHWSVQVFDYIRIQVLFIQVMVLIGSFFLLSQSSTLILILHAGLLLAIAYQVFIITPYVSIKSIFKKKEAANFKTSGNQISIVTANVLQKNTEYHRLIGLVNNVVPDILLTTETNKLWEEALEEIEDDFSFSYKIALENRYGMHFYTKLKAIEIKEHFLISEETPSIEALLVDKNDNRFVFWGIHPPPPSPTEKPTSRQNDAELMKLAKLIRNTGYPSIVVGDFNDVCWSRSSRLFAKVSKLKDVRKGRGILGTFPVRPSIFRFPLDLIFCSKEMQVHEIKILSDIGSDHLPLFSKFSITSKNQSTKEKMDTELKEEIEEIIEDGYKAVQEE